MRIRKISSSNLNESSRVKGKRSHYLFKNFIYDDSGKRISALPVLPINNAHPHLISSVYRNPSKNTKTLYCLMLDLDVDRAANEWKNEHNSLCWIKIASFLVSKHPDLMPYISIVLKSSGGHGLHLVFGITPLELVESTESCQKVAKVILAKLYNLFNFYQMGVDKGALGLERDFVNWLNLANVIDGSVSSLLFIQSDKIRPPVLNNLITLLNSIKEASGYVHKKESSSFLYPDLRCELKLAKLYEYLHTKLFDDGLYTVSLSSKEIIELTGLTKPTLRKILNQSCLPWLSVEYMGHGNGWSLKLNLDVALTQRAYDLLNNVSSLYLNKEVKVYDLTSPLSKPEEVKDGERNEWLTKLTLMLKHAAIDENQALNIIRNHIQRIDGYKNSRNCKNVRTIVKNIYANKPELFGVKGILPYGHDWIFEKEIKFKKGHSPYRV